MESEEITKLVDGIYKNISEKFNPGTRQMINAGKAYLKALHGAAAASRVYVDAITKLARQAQQATWLGCSDIGSALMQVVEVYKETQAHQINILKAFYVDVLVPLETNLEKDTKVVQADQKRFLQQHKQHIESYTKASANVKKYRKKHGRGNKNMDKELKSMQTLEEEKNKLDEFCEHSLKYAITQERRRYGFVLERQSSLAKHNLVFYEKQQELMEKYINSWVEIAKAREQIPEAVINMFTSNMTQINLYPEESNERGESADDEDVISVHSQLRKSQSVDTNGHLPLGTNNREGSASVKQMPLTKSRSDFNITESTQSLHRLEDCNGPSMPGGISRPIHSAEWSDNKEFTRALYSYLSNGENQLSFLKGDLIAVIGDRNKGWQYGENLRTKFRGWFPTAYTESVSEMEEEIDINDTDADADGLECHTMNNTVRRNKNNTLTSGERADSIERVDVEKLNNKYSANKTSGGHKFGDSVIQRHQIQTRGRMTENAFGVVPPPIMPAPTSAPILSPSNSERDTRLSSGHQGTNDAKKLHNGNASLHSSNDSGFSNDPPPAPDIDYSDDEQSNNRSKSYASTKKSVTERNINEQKNLNGTCGNGKGKTLNYSASKEFSQGTNSINDWLNDDMGAGTTEYSTATLYSKRRHPPMRQSSSVGHLVTLGRISSAQSEKDFFTSNACFDKKVKRTKSLWKFKKTDDVLEGMSLWKHRSLVDVTNYNDNGTKFGRGGGTPVFDKRMSMTREISVDSGDENSTIMNETVNENIINARKNGIQRRNSDNEESDQESCIVVDDHTKTDSIDAINTANINSTLPRTRLTKANLSSSMMAPHNKMIPKSYASNYEDLSTGTPTKSDIVFESNKLRNFKYNRVSDPVWYDSWGERRKK